ncbi:carbonic anhydrase [Sulfolobus islandicus Y.N.15.51]|uniref:Carbonic anhydrase n=2 Tax=Saccharolobus islandicus TaxID=43080 RepID=C3NJS7_SACI1|nr:carbonic anhydrase [Sulfolobus islandicus]ACP47329.1 carbonic anhydrase [Sulfolobus islandicus Y.N.15.51]ADB88497.1 carbonic anhydrase [Sulfolobus islandicus L.D.8.5]
MSVYSGMKLVVSCMDRRLNSYLKKKYPDAIVIRNAGANVNSLLITFEKYKDRVDDVILLPHTDCGAMKVVYSSLKEGKKITSLVEEKLVSQFSSKKFSSLSELERLNMEIQKENLKRIFGDKVRTELIDVNKIEIPPSNEPYMAYVSKPSQLAELSSNIYHISAEDKEIWDSLDIAVYAMKINKIITPDEKTVEKIKAAYPSVIVSTTSF